MKLEFKKKIRANMDVSIIIVNYNTRELTLQCLESIYKLTIDINFEVILVDNASSDGSVDAIKIRFPEVKVIQSSENLGFGRANNLGIRQSLAKYVFLLNPDTILLNNAPKLFYNYMEEYNVNGTIGCIGSILLDIDKNGNLSYGPFPTIGNEIKYLSGKISERILKKSTLSLQNKKLDANLSVDFISGADLFIPKKVLVEIGDFDKHFFMFYEETDLQKRMFQKGLKRIIIDGPQIIHLEGKSFSTKSNFSYSKFILSQKSLNYYIRKHFKGLSYLSFRIGISFIRLTILFDNRFTLKEKLKAFKTVIFFEQ